MNWHQTDNGNHVLIDDHDKLRGTVYIRRQGDGWGAVIDGQHLGGSWTTPEGAKAAAETFAEDIDRGIAFAHPTPIPAWRRAKKGHFYKRTPQGVVGIYTDKFGKGYYAYNDGRVWSGGHGFYWQTEQEAMMAVEGGAGMWILAPWEQ
jgi:hypothetical protein